MSSEGVVAEVRHHSAPRIHMAVDAKRTNADEDMAGMVTERLAIESKSSKRTMAAFLDSAAGALADAPLREDLLVRCPLQAK